MAALEGAGLEGPNLLTFTRDTDITAGPSSPETGEFGQRLLAPSTAGKGKPLGASPATSNRSLPPPSDGGRSQLSVARQGDASSLVGGDASQGLSGDAPRRPSGDASPNVYGQPSAAQSRALDQLDGLDENQKARLAKISSRVSTQQGLFGELLNSAASHSTARVDRQNLNTAQHALDNMDQAVEDFKRDVGQAKTPEEKDAALRKLNTAMDAAIKAGHEIFGDRATLEIRANAVGIAKTALVLSGLSLLGAAAGATANALVQKGKQK